MLFEIALEEKTVQSLRFVPPLLAKEEGELEKASEELGLSLKRLVEAFHLGELRPLSDGDWKRMNNTESWGTTSMEKVKEKSEYYERDFQSLTKAFKQNNSIEAPIVLKRQDATLYLVAGDTRLMCMRAMGIKPSVYVISL